MDSGLVALGLSGLAFVAGYAEVKFKANLALSQNKDNSTRIERLEAKVEDLNTRVFDKLSSIERMLTERLATIEGQLKNHS